jgi:exodeoxyribonuclease VII large subunit
MEDRRVEGVSRVVGYLRRVIEENKALKQIAVRGEVTGLSRNNGRIYFALREGTDQLNCVVWVEPARTLPAFGDGDEVIVRGDFGTYAARSVYQLSVTALELTGIGQLYAQVEALRKRLDAEGLFASERKRPLPRFPQRVALISARGKGAEDFLTTIARRAPHIAVDFVETRVQGDGAHLEIADAIDEAARRPVDLIVVARGGGSYEDLFPFNLEPVVRAIVRSRLPVMTAIGHTGDRHLADEAADKTVETPSNAAQYFGELRDWHLRRVERLAGQLDLRVRALLGGAAQRLDGAALSLGRRARDLVAARRDRLAALERRLQARTPAAQLAERGLRLAGAAARLRATAPRITDPKRARAAAATQRLEAGWRLVLGNLRQRRLLLDARLSALDPHAPLARGFALVFAEGRLVRDASSVAAGTEITAKLARGTLRARVEGSSDD